MEMAGHGIGVLAPRIIIIRQDDDLLVFEIMVEFFPPFPGAHGVAAGGQAYLLQIGAILFAFGDEHHLGLEDVREIVGNQLDIFNGVFPVTLAIWSP